MLNEMYYFKEDKSAFSKRFEELMKKNNLKLNDVVEIFEEKTKTNSYELIKKWRYGERLPDIEYFDISRDISYDNGGFVSIKFTFKNKKKSLF